MKNKILHYFGVFVIVLSLMSSTVSPLVKIGPTPKSSDDGYEDNDDFSSAAPITPDYYPGLNASDEDWYYFHADIGEMIIIDMYYTEGDLNFVLYNSLYSFCDSSSYYGDGEQIIWVATHSDDYYIQVNGDTNGQLYDLNIDLGASDDDYLEDNDDFSSASEVYDNSFNLIAIDDDWFKVSLEYGMKLNIEINYEYIMGDLNLSLYDDSEILLLTSTKTLNDEYISWDAHYSGDHYILIEGLNLNYNMLIERCQPNTYVEYEYTQNPDPYFNYGVNENDEFIYDVIFDVDFTASNQFYDLLDEYYINQSKEGHFYNLSSDFSTEKIINDLENIVQQNFDLKINTKDIYNSLLNCSWGNGFLHVPYHGNVYFPDGGYYIENLDYFFGGLAVDLGDGSGWEEPQVIALQFLSDYKELLLPHFEGQSQTDFLDDYGYIDDDILNLFNGTDWDNIDFEMVLSSREYYYQNGTQISTDFEFMDVEPPFPEFMGAVGLPFFLPTQMNFEDYYNYLNDVIQEWRPYCDDNPSDCEWPDELSDVFNLGDLEGKVGITNIEVQSNAIGISFNLDEVDAELIEIIDFFTGLEEIGIYNFTGTINYALEFDDNWVLLSMAIYIDGDLTLDWINIPDAPINFNIEVLELDLVLTICQQGYYPPSIDQIQNGEVGENRNPSSMPFDIPSYPLAALGIIGLISVFALIKKYKK